MIPGSCWCVCVCVSVCVCVCMCVCVCVSVCFEENMTGWCWCEPPPPYYSFARHLVGKGRTLLICSALSTAQMKKNQIPAIRLFQKMKTTVARTSRVYHASLIFIVFMCLFMTFKSLFFLKPGFKKELCACFVLLKQTSTPLKHLHHSNQV